MPYRPVECADRATMAGRVAQAIVDDLQSAIELQDRASLIVPGGTTPVAVFEQLAEVPLPWNKVTIIPCDERWVPLDHPDSNEGLIRRHLCRDGAQGASILSLYRNGLEPATAVAQVSAVLAAVPRPFSSVFLGMGEDGHFASLFPGRPETQTALSPTGTAEIMTLSEPAKGHQRIGLTLAALLQCRRILLAVSGQEKRMALNRAIDNINTDTFPVSALLRQQRTPVEIFLGA
ncbi:6-phosphogluconolactonase [Dongia sp.]|uniref:6-phosphogluconolactonase n=1 Tax=Dongia sp. TaxID=1977262 RepID=UPI0035AE2326